MKPSRICVLTVVALLGGAMLFSSSMAQNAAIPARATRVAVCDVGHVFDNYARRQDLNAEFARRAERLQAESDQRLKAIEDIKAELAGLMVGSEAYESRLREAERLAYERKAWIEHQTSMAERDRHRLTRQIYQQIIEAVAKVAKANGVDIVVYRKADIQPTENLAQLQQQMELRKVLYAAASTDITDGVLSELNRAYAAEGQ